MGELSTLKHWAEKCWVVAGHAHRIKLGFLKMKILYYFANWICIHSYTVMLCVGGCPSHISHNSQIIENLSTKFASIQSCHEVAFRAFPPSVTSLYLLLVKLQKSFEHHFGPFFLFLNYKTVCPWNMAIPLQEAEPHYLLQGKCFCCPPGTTASGTNIGLKLI